MQSEILDDFNKQCKQAQDWLMAEFRNIKTGRATPALVENITVEVYGTSMPLLQLASITAPEPNLLVVKPWDQTNLKDINKSLEAADTGATCSINGDVVHLQFAPITEERRQELVRKVKQKLEEAKIRVRNARDKAREQINQSVQDKEMSEDEKYSLFDDIDKQTKTANEAMKELVDKKESDLMAL
ncbi:MAG: ribosome recycling factor [Candidatus Komeilibacteria bacterium]